MSHISDSDHRKLEATILPDCVVESHQITDAARGWRRVQITKLWRTERVLGSGGFGEVLLQALDNDTEKKRALKVIRGVKMTQDECQRELTAMIEFTKPKYQAAAVFVELFGWFQNPNDHSMYLAMEYMRGGDLEANLLDLESLTENGLAIPEKDVKEITSQILEGLKIMHAEGFAHRDLKPKNIFVVQRKPEWWVKLGDFGLTKKQADGTVYRTHAGTEKYMAPELYFYVPGLNKETSEYTNAVDIWALGCIVYRIITRAVPFPSLLSLRNYSNCDEELLFEVLSPMAEAEAFVQKLLTPHPAKRPTASAALEHSWVITNGKTKITHDYTAASSISKINIESQSGYNSASHPGLRSYWSPPETYNASKSSLSQGAASEPSLEPKPMINSIQRPFSSFSKPTPSYGSQTSLTQKPLLAHIRSRSEGSRHLDVVERMIEKETDDKAKDHDRQMTLRVAADNGHKVVAKLPPKESDGNTKERNPGHLVRYEASDKDHDQDVDFVNTSAFVAWRYQDIINIISDTLNEEDQLVCKEHRTWQDLLAEIRKKVVDSKSSAAIRRVMSSIQPLPRSMATLNGSFISALTPNNVQFDFLWGLVYLNLKLSYSSTDKLKRTAEWLGNLRRVVELFSRCLDICEGDPNEPRLAMIEIYDHILSMLQETLLYLRSYPKDADAAKAWPQMNAQLQQHFTALDASAKHLNDITIYSKVNLENTVRNLSNRYTPTLELEEHTNFPCINVPFLQYDKFFGREAEMLTIINHLTPKKDVQELRTYIIYGRRGVGKTEIALQYVYENLSGFDAIFWIQCETSVTLRQSFTNAAVALNLPNANALGHHEENLLAVQKWLKLTTRKWLLIFDNAERESILKGYWPVGAKGAILITSRKYYNFNKDSQRKGVTVGPFNEQQSFDLLMVLLGENWQNQYSRGLLRSTEITAAKTLLKKIGGLALAIQQAAVLINNPDIGCKNIAGALELFNSNAQRLLERPDTDRSEMVHALDTLWNMNFSILSPNARNLLSVLAMLSPDSMLIDLFQPKKQSALNVNNKLSFIRHNFNYRTTDDSGDSLASMIISPSLEAALAELLGKGLIRIDNRIISVHRVIQEAMNYHSIEDLQASFDAAVSIVYEAFPKAWTGDILHKYWPVCQTYITHSVHICMKYIDYTQPSSRAHIRATDTFTALIANCAWYLYEIGDYETCLKLADTASNACENKQSTRYANLRNTAGTCYFDMNRLQDCRRDYEIALAIQENEPDHDDVKVAYMLHNMGNLETGSGRYEEALDYYYKAIKIRNAQGDLAAGQLALTYLSVGRLYYFRGMYEEASKYLASSEVLFVRSSGADTHFMAFVHFVYGNIEFARKHERSAKRSYLDALKIAAAGTLIHFITSAIYYKLGCVELTLKNHEVAIGYLDKALTIAELRSPAREDGNIARILFKISKVLENDILTIFKAQELLNRAEIARKNLTGRGEGYAVEILDEEGNMDYIEQDEAYDALVSIFYR